MELVNIVGGGLAGVEAAWQAARLGANVRLYEMRPVMQTPAHRTDKLAEIVCSNSLKSDEPGSAPYLLKEELRRGSSLVMEAAEATRVPAGAALSVDRAKFAEYITEKIEQHPRIEIVREEIRSADTLVRMDAASASRDLRAGGTGDADKTVRTPSLETELKALVAKDMGKPLAPSRVHFVSALPKTRNAKVMRRVIRTAYLGEDAGDLSALENPQAVDEIARAGK